MSRDHIRVAMKHSYTRINITAAVILPTAIVYGQVLSQPIILSVTDPRPLAKAGELFERRYGIPVSYEDVAYVYDGDVIDQTDPDYKKTHPNIRALIPRGGAVTIRGQAGAVVPTPREASLVLQTALDDHARANNPGEFALLQNSDGLVIVPSSSRDANGILAPDHSPLETNISFLQVQRTALEALESICSAVTGASGKKVVVGTTPFRSLSGQMVVKVGAVNEQARSVLFRALAGIQPTDPRTKAPSIKLAWQLLYDPGERMYALNVHQVMMEAPSPAGVKILRPVTR
jgi:hypothetical protein